MPMPDSIRKTPLRRGYGGKEVRWWQELLKRKGFAVTVDGIFGPKTENATKVAQSWAGIPPTGIVGAHTWRAVDAKRRTRRPLSTAKALAGRPKVLDCRDGRNGFPRHPTRRWQPRSVTAIVAIVGHHTGGPASFAADARFHVYSDYLDQGGAPAIAYALGVDLDGTVFVFNDPTSLTWHCDGGKNTVTLGIVVRGNTDVTGMPLAQRRSLRWLYAALEKGGQLPGYGVPIRVLKTTHRHITSTGCPGERGEAFYRSISGGDWRSAI